MPVNGQSPARRQDRGRAGDGAEAVALYRRRGQPGAQAAGDRARRPLLPRRVRGRDLEPGPADPVPADQPARRAWRPSGCTARGPTWPTRCAAQGLPLFTLESWRPVREADLLGITLQAELTYSNVLEVLDLAGIPLRAADRGEGDPIVVAGGPSASNPAPLAPFFDAVFMGESERAFEAVLDVIATVPGRAARLAALAENPYLYLPRARPPPGRAGRLRRLRHRDAPDPGGRAVLVGDLLAGVGRGHARLHPRLPLLPRRHLVPARARAPARRGGRGRARPARLHRLRRALADVARDERLHRHRAGDREDQDAAADAAPVASVQPGRHRAGGADGRGQRPPELDHAGARGGHAADARHHLQDDHRRDDRARDRGGVPGRLHAA